MRAAARGVRLVAMELVPRITRAQSMDALSSMATIAGYKAVLLAAEALPQNVSDAQHGRRHGHGRARVSSSAPAWRGSRPSPRPGAWARESRPTTCGRPSRNRSRALAPGSSSCRSRPATRRTPGGYARAQDESFYRRQRELMHKTVAASDVVITTAAIPGKQRAGSRHTARWWPRCRQVRSSSISRPSGVATVS